MLRKIIQREIEETYGVFAGGDFLSYFTAPGDTRVILSLLVWRQPQVILEIGTALGHMTANLCHWSPPSARVYTIGICREMNISLPDDQIRSGELHRREEVGVLANHFGDGGKAIRILDDSLNLGSLLWQGRIERPDFVFIDGNHSYHHVRQDTDFSLAYAHIIVWHDYGSQEGVTRVVHKTAENQEVFVVEGTMVAFMVKRDESS